MNRSISGRLFLLATLLLWPIGCSDQRVAQIAREAADRQAQQNQAMAELQEHITEGASQLVEADAQARQEILGVHRDLQSERSRLDRSWDKLHQQRRSESLLVALLPTLGMAIAVCLLPGFCWYAVFAAHTEDVSTSELSELLVEELTSDSPRLSLGGARLPALPDSSQDDHASADA